MSDASNNQTAREIIACLSPGDCLGSQKTEMLSLPFNETLMLGVILGQARGLSYRHNPQDESKPSVALVGPFTFVPFSTARSELRSMRCFLPTTLHDVIIAALQGDKEAPVTVSPKRKDKPIDVQLGNVVEIAVEIGAMHVDAGIPYKYVTREVPGHQVKLEDPLSQLKLSVASKVKALPPPSARMAQTLAATDKAPAKASRSKKK